jgi:protein-L-isoaspartate O-methyltransferase
MHQMILDQLAPGGAIWAPVGPKGGNQQIIVYKKDNKGTITQDKIMGVRYGSLGTVQEQIGETPATK